MSIKVPGINEAEAWTAGSRLPEGVYSARVIDADEGTSSGGFDQITLQFEVIEGECKGAQIRDWLVITERSYGRVKGVLEALGYVLPADEEINANQLIGLAVYITVKHEPWNGETKDRIKVYTPAPDIAPLQPVAPSTSEASKQDDDIPF